MATDRVTWLGHATVLLELGGARLVTDPVLRPRVAHLVREAPLPDDPGRLDAILISHGHHDHLDLPTVRRLDPSAIVVAPPNTGWALRLAQHAVRKLSPGDELELAGVRIRAVPAAHDGRRVPVGEAASAVGFVVAGVYFAGDTEPFPEMAELAGTLEVALLPVAGWGPKVGPGPHGPAAGRRGAGDAAPARRGADPLGDLPPDRAPADRASPRRSSSSMRRGSRRRCGWRCSSPASRWRSPGRCDARSPRRGGASAHVHHHARARGSPP